MNKFRCLLIIIAALAVLPLQTASGQAQATRTWVSGVGDDANPCSRTAPCKTFAGAISKTAASGEINVIDPGGFGAVTITKSITIRSQVEAGVLVSGTNGVIVNLAAQTDKVTLDGLDIEGIGTGLAGIKMIGTGKLMVSKCSIRNFTGFGVDVQGTAGARVFVVDSMIVGNAGGVHVQGVGGAANSALVERSLLDINSLAAVEVDGAGNVLVLNGSTLSGSTSSIVVTAGGSVISYGNNVLRNPGLPTSTTPLQ